MILFHVTVILNNQKKLAFNTEIQLLHYSDLIKLDSLLSESS